MNHHIALIHKTAEPVSIVLARVPVKGDFVEHDGGPWEVKRVLLHHKNSIAATVWAVPADFPLTLPG